MKWVSLLAGALLLGTVHSETREPALTVAGQVLFSFEDPHYLVQSGDFIFRLKKSGLSSSLQESLSTVGGRIRITIPVASIDMAWRAIDPKDRALGHVNVRPNDLAQAPGFKRAKNGFEIAGTVLPSFNDSYLIVQSGDSLIRIKEKPGDKGGALARAKAGDVLTLKIPPASIDLVWLARTNTPLGRSPASQGTQPDIVAHMHDGQVLIRGRMHHSFQEPHVLIQANDTIYQIKKASLSPADAAKLEGSPSRVSIVVPEAGVLMNWRIYSLTELEK
jgi:hypothetical protein